MDRHVRLFEEYAASDASGYDVGEYVYHVTQSASVGAILEEGLVPKDGVSVNGAPFEGRLYFATSLIAAYDLSVNFESLGRGDDYTILKVDSSCLGGGWENDPLFAHGVYVGYPVDARFIVGAVRADDLFGMYDDADLDELY